MKIKIAIFIALIISALLLNSHDNHGPSEILKEIKWSHKDNYENLLKSTDNLVEAAKLLENSEVSVELLKKSYSVFRNAYKKTEIFLDYFDKELTFFYVNGAPLPKLEPNSPSLSVLEPSGIQVIDELAWSDDPFAEKDEIIKQAEYLRKYLNNAKNSHLLNDFTFRHIFEASRFNLVRIFALGVTGFDTPSSLTGINDAMVSLNIMRDYIGKYYHYLEHENTNISYRIDVKFDGAIKFLKDNKDFDSFDRMTFLRDYINPLYSMIVEAQRLLGIEFYDEIVALKSAANYQAKDIFHEDFLNPYYYTRLSKEEDSEPIRVLGKILFFDPVLSENNERACASCHHPDKAFTDGMPKSIAYDFEGTVERNSPTLVNSVFSTRFFYDLRSEMLETQFDHVITSGSEFNSDFIEIENKLKKSSEYSKLFKEAFPGQNIPINKYTIGLALSSYVASLRSFDSPFDKYARGETHDLPENAKRGFNLFMGKAACGTCHFAPTFNGLIPPYYEENESEVLGVPSRPDTSDAILDEDIGRYGGFYKETAEHFKHSFKTTTVRNIELTTPYMHNGVYKTLEEVLDFYNRGGGAGIGIELPNQTLPPDPLNLTETEIADIIAFMKSLTDTTGLTSIPHRLPKFENQPELNTRTIGGNY